MDIGGTNTRVGTSHDGRHFFVIKKFQTPHRFSDGIKKIIACVRKLQTAHKLNGLVVAIPGTIDRHDGASPRLPNLPGWSNRPIAQQLAAEFHTKIRLVNDADAAGIGEARRGAGRGFNRVAYFTISTGIGGARLINGAIDPKAHNFEPGHQLLIPQGRNCACGRHGCFEAYGSGTAFYKTYGVRTENCKDQRIWNEYARTLGQGIINAVEHPHLPHPPLSPWERDAEGGVRGPNRFSPHAHATPDIIIIGGGVSQVGPRLFTPLRAYIKKNLKILKPPPIKKAALGDLAGLYGGLELLHNTILAY